MQRGRRRDGNDNSEDYYGVDAKEDQADSEDEESYEIDQGPNPAEQYGL